jgi:CheY-like chemotaxis protein
MAVKTILIVEDEPIIGMELKESLEKLGYNVPEVIRNAVGVMSGGIKNNPDVFLMAI